MNATRAEVLAAVNSSPHGVTTAELSERLGATAYNVGSVLSKLAAYGFIGKIESGRCNGYLWLRKDGRI